MLEREVKRVGVILISSDRGLCGGLNTNLFKATLSAVRKWREAKTQVDMCTVGQKASVFFKRFGGNIVAQTSHLGDTPHLEDLIGTVRVMLDSYEQGTIDQLFLVFNHFKNTMSQVPIVQQLLPISAEIEDSNLTHHWDYLYEPESQSVLDGLLMRYIESLVYQGVVENVACEQAARMVAMKAASDNASSLIGELQLAYNKARQASITQELSEIVGGAAAV
jgi:F-type H+-transporting ATPase subunit gamma